MTNQKTTSKKQSIVIAILSVLLVGLLAFNITYAFFTDRGTQSGEFTFGKIDLAAVGGSILTSQSGIYTEDLSRVQPGDTLTGNFAIVLAQGSEDAFIRYKLTASLKDLTYNNSNKLESYKVGATTYTVTYNGNAIESINNGSADLADDALATQVAYVTDMNNRATAILATLADLNAAFHDGVGTIGNLNATGTDYNRLAIDTTGYTVAGDDWIYKNTLLAGNQNATSSTSTIQFTYQIPFSTGNALQGIAFSLDLQVEAVQAANVNDTALSETDITAATNINSESDAYAAVKMFYAASATHGGILVNMEG